MFMNARRRLVFVVLLALGLARAGFAQPAEPAQQGRGHSALSLGPRSEADFMIFRAGPITQVHVPAYTRADARFEWKLTSRLSATAVGQNLFSRSHVEFAGSEKNIVATRMPRSASVRLTCRF